MPSSALGTQIDLGEASVQITGLDYSGNGYTLADGNITCSSITVEPGVSGSAITAGLNLSGPLAVSVAQTESLSVSGAISGASGPSLTETGGGSLLVSGSSSGLATTTVVAGSFIATSQAGVPSDSSLVVGAGGAFVFDPAALAAAPFRRVLPPLAAPDTSPAASEAGVSYATDASTLSADDLGLGTTRSYNSQMGMSSSSGGVGQGWTLDQPFAMAKDAHTVAIVFSASQSYLFGVSGGAYTPLDWAKETLSADTTHHLLIMTTPAGGVYAFNDLSVGGGDARSGQFLSYAAPNGSIECTTATDPNAWNQIAEIQWYASASAYASKTACQAETFSYDTTTGDANFGRLDSIVLEGYSDGALVNARMVSYGYYGVSAAHGNRGDLESATEQFWDPTLNAGNGGWSLAGESSYYYRYDTTGLNGLTLALTPQEVSTAGGITVVAGMSDSALQPYASAAFEYSGRYVTQATVDGLSTYSYASLPDIGAAFSGGGPNIWSTETQETRPDGSTLSVYTNVLGETLLSDLADPATDSHWVTYAQYGTQPFNYGLVVLAAGPSAIDTTTCDDQDAFGQNEYGYDSAATNLAVAFNSSGRSPSPLHLRLGDHGRRNHARQCLGLLEVGETLRRRRRPHGRDPRQLHVLLPCRFRRHRQRRTDAGDPLPHGRGVDLSQRARRPDARHHGLRLHLVECPRHEHARRPGPARNHYFARRDGFAERLRHGQYGIPILRR